MTPHAAIVENGRDRWKTPDANPRYEPDSGVNAAKCPPKAVREPDTEVATAGASSLQNGTGVRGSGHTTTPDNGHSAEILNGNDRD